jgi:hypothetical protein
MTALAHTPAAFAIRDPGRAITFRASAPRLTLRPTEDGWTLIGAHGEVVFRGAGVRARRACLEFARAHGVLAVFS